MITRIREEPGGTDKHGVPIPGATTETVIDDAFVGPRTSDSITGGGRVGVLVGLTLFCPYGTDLHPDDQIRVTGEGANDGLYKIEGAPGDWRNPWTNWEAGQTTDLVRVDG